MVTFKLATSLWYGSISGGFQIMKLNFKKTGVFFSLLTLFVFMIFYNNCSQSFITKELPGSSSNQSSENNGSNDNIHTDSGAITYSKDIRPIIQNRCSTCHQSGGIAPFPLLNYSQVKDQSGIILADIKSRRMPPWGAKDDGTCQSFQHSMWMPDSEIAIFQKWVDQNTKEGTKTSSITPAAASAHYDLNDPNIVEYKMPSTYSSNSTQTDEYRCFVTSEANVDRLITGFDIVPGNPKVVHHVIVFAPSSEADESAAISKGVGYDCPGGPLVNASIAAFWAAGTQPMDYPVINGKQTGLRIPAGRRLILQMHYNYSLGRESDLSGVRFKVMQNNVKEGLWFIFGKASGSETIPAGQAAFNLPQSIQIGTAITGTTSTSSTPGFIYAIVPHMHQTGSKIKVELSRDPSTKGNSLANECLLDVPAWDFHWQRIYWFKNPVRADVLDTMKMTCTYNTQGRTQPTKFGENSTDEMCITFAFVTDSQI